MRVNSFVTRRVHIFLGASEQFLMEGVPRYQEKDTKRKASIREIEVVIKYNEEDPGSQGFVYRVMARGRAVNQNGDFGSIDRTFEFIGLDSLPEDIQMEVKALFKRQYILNDLDESYDVAREDGLTGTPVLEVLS